MTWHTVDLEPDHLTSIAKTRPTNAFAELIWNAIDAEANQIRIAITDNGLGGVAAITVTDNGHGMTHDEAIQGFTHLGGSWKKSAERSKNGERVLHGKDGKGRFTAFALGQIVEWHTVAIANGTRKLVKIQGNLSKLDGFEISFPENTDRAVGTTVTISPGAVAPTGLDSAPVRDRLTTHFGMQLTMYPSMTITYDGDSLDAATLIKNTAKYEIERPDGTTPAHMTVIEWTSGLNVSRGLFLCDSDGVALADLRVGIQAPGYDFTAYLLWDRFRERMDDLLLAEADPEMEPVVEAARNQLRTHFALRQKQRGRETVERWRSGGVYPYPDNVGSKAERVARDTFDVVALQAASVINSSDSKKSQRLTLRLMKEGLETDPGALHRVLEEVLDLSSESVEELDQLLAKTTLAELISMTRLVSDRLEFIEALRVLVFDPETKGKLKERSELHRILEKETWIFGEEYAVTASDRTLTTALKAHRKILGNEDSADTDPVLDDSGTIRVLDLLLARSVPQNEERYEHLVVELKAPKVRIGDREVLQIKNYARAVAADERFNKVTVRWKFIIVSNDMTPSVRKDASQSDREPGLIIDDGEIKIWAMTWAEVISKAEHRMKFLKERLGYAPADEQAVAYLNERHRLHIPEHLQTTDQVVN